MEFLVDFKVNVPTGTPESEVEDREKAEASATAKLADEGHLVRLWRRTVTSGDRPIVGLFRADSATELDSIIGALPLHEWLDVNVTPLKSHANDPAEATVPSRPDRRTGTSLPDPGFAKVYRLEATLGQPLDTPPVGGPCLFRCGQHLVVEPVRRVGGKGAGTGRWHRYSLCRHLGTRSHDETSRRL